MNLRFTIYDLRLSCSDKLCIIAVTRGGVHLAARLAPALGADLAIPARFVDPGSGFWVLGSGTYDCSVLEEIRHRWEAYRSLVLIMASGVAVRAIAPLLGHKTSDPAVICLDEAGRWAIPLLGGHQAGANDLARRIAALTGGQAAITTASDAQGKPALDLLGLEQGWRIEPASRGDGVARSPLTHASACLVNGAPVGLYIDPELTAALELAEGWLAQADNLLPVAAPAELEAEEYAAGLIVSYRRYAGLSGRVLAKSVLYRPPVLVVGMGCRRGVPPQELRVALEATLADADLALGSVGALATADIKADEAGLRALAADLGVPLLIVASVRLAALDPAGFSPSAARAKFDLPGVAEPCALLASGGTLIVPKRSFARCTVAVAVRAEPRTKNQEPTAQEQRTTQRVPDKEQNGQELRTKNQEPTGVDSGSQFSVLGSGEGSQFSVLGSGEGSRFSVLALIGIGPGDPRQMTIAAREALCAAEVVIGYRVYIEQVRALLAPGREIIASPIGSEVERARLAVELAAAGRRVALISSGDIGIYAMAAPVFEVLRERGWAGNAPEVAVFPGISAVQAAAARLGAPIGHDFCTISLSDLLTPWEMIERRLWAAAQADFVIALYNPRSRERDWQLARALEILRAHRLAGTPVAAARNLTRPDERVALTTLADFDPSGVDMWTLVLVGNSQSYITGGRMATPRGYTRGS